MPLPWQVGVQAPAVSCLLGCLLAAAWTGHAVHTPTLCGGTCLVAQECYQNLLSHESMCCPICLKSCVSAAHRER